MHTYLDVYMKVSEIDCVYCMCQSHASPFNGNQSMRQILFFCCFFFLDFYYDCQLVQMNKFFDTILLCKYYIFEYFEMNFGSNQ